MNINGKATLDLQDQKIKVLTNLDLEDGIIRCYPETPISEMEKLMLMTNKATLEDFESEMLQGNVTKDCLDDIFVIKFFDEDYESALHSHLLREFKFIDDYEPQEIIFKLKNSRLELNIEHNSEFNKKTEIHFLNCWIESDFEIDLLNYSSQINADKSGHALCCFNKSLNSDEIEHFKSVFTTTYCLAQGNFPILKECLTSNKLILNLANHRVKSKPHQFIPPPHLKSLFNKVSKLFQQLSENKLSKFKNTLYYFENGLNYDVHLEIRCISLFNAFEIIDNSDSLDKSMLKEHLNLETLFDSAFLIQLRNEIIHNGLSLIKAIEKIEPNIRENDKDESELLNIFETGEHRKHVATYFFMVNKLHKNLLNKLSYTKSVNPY